MCTVIKGFKEVVYAKLTTNEYIREVKNLGWPPFNGKLWRPNYWEHIIRTKKSYKNISEYIANNHKNWKKINLKGINNLKQFAIETPPQSQKILKTKNPYNL